MNGKRLKVDTYSNPYRQRASVYCSLCRGAGSLVLVDGEFVHRERPCPDPEEMERSLAEFERLRRRTAS